LASETGGRYVIQQSFDLVNWLPYLSLTNTIATIFLTVPSGGTNPQSFFRATKAN
jgi:hypothetical protein